MPSNQNSQNGSPQFNPLIPSTGRGKGSKNLLQSNTFKFSLAGVVILVIIFIIVWQFVFTGSEQRSTVATASAGAQDIPSPPPEPQAPPATPSSPEEEQPSDQTNPPNAQPDVQNAAAQPQAEQSPVEQQPATDVGTNDSGNHQTPPGEETLANVTPLPEDFSKWNKEDFLRARDENHPKLLEAIAYQGANFPGKVAVAQMLSDLLKTPKPSVDAAGLSRSGPMGAPPGMIETIVAALGQNGSQTARQTLTQILNGKFAVDDDRRAVEAVLKTLVELPSPDNDDILIKALISPELLRPASAAPESMGSGGIVQGTMLPEDIRARALDLVKQNASENLRTKLADNLVSIGLELNDPILSMLMEDNPANLGAQLALYPSEDLSNDLKARLEQYFLNYASLAIGLTLGLPLDSELLATSGTSLGGAASGMRERTPPPIRTLPGATSLPSEASAERLSDYDRGVHFAKLLWGEPLASLMSQSLADTRSLERQAPEIVLASTLPLDSIRAAMYKMLKKRAVNEGPQSLETAGWPDKAFADPSLIVILKMLKPRSMKTASLASGLGGVGVGGGGRMPAMRYPQRRPSATDVGGAFGDTAQRKEQIEMDWLITLSKMVGIWSNRLEAASQAQKRAARRGQKVLEPPPTKMDEFDLPQDVKITAAYQLNWPEKASQDLGNVKPGALKMQYFRLEQEGLLTKTKNTMKRLAKGGDIHELNNGFWLDMLKNVSQSNGKRSLDIVVTAPDQQPVDYTQREEPADLLIEILAVEIPDPASFKE